MLVPAALHTCREARSLGLYQRDGSEVFATFAALSAEGVTILIEPKFPPYLWLNWDIDIVSVRTTPLHLLLPVAPRVKRLRLERHDTAADFFRSEGDHLAEFVNVEEIQIVCVGELRRWGEAGEKYLWPCSSENLFFIETTHGRRMKDGTMMKAAELEAMIEGQRAEAEERWRQRYEGGSQEGDPYIGDVELDALLASRRDEEERSFSPERSGFESL
ncbi:hypothetical protein PG996_006055 [Apiospora saccharicola]|uniref:Uncharacterized protein n=1 Tax=Apiospora saccharicola TaxID=335842 RepID=A0ABR1VNA2_9PEZI